MAKRQNRIDNMVSPIITCPKCSGNCYPVSLNISCEKCEDSYSVDSEVLSNNTEYVLIKSDELSRYMSYLLVEKEKEFTVTYKGQILSALENLRKLCDFPTTLLVVKYITEGFLYILKEMSQMQGEKIYLVDNLGNKSKELKREFLRNAYDSFNEDRDRNAVDKFIRSLTLNNSSNTKEENDGKQI